MQVTATSFKELCSGLKSQSPAINIDMVRKAHEFALHIHKNQATPSGRKRIEHLLNTAKILAKLVPDEETLTATILHDSIIHGNVEKEELEKLFGKEIANLVEEYTKEISIEETNIDRIGFELLSKIVLASAKDIRSLFIKIAATIDYSWGGEYPDMELAEKKALIALNVYAPICHKLGLNEFEWMLEDTAFKQLYRNEYISVKGLVGEKIAERGQKMEKIRARIELLMKKSGLNALIQSRAKHFYSIFKKMKKKPFSEIYDIYGIRIICENEEDCYKALGTINSNYDSIEHKFRDYIADPKENRYRSIHTVILFGGQPVETQIRTWQMHWDDEVGLAAHWQYKEHRKDKYFDKKLSVIKQLMEWHKTQMSSANLGQSLKTSGGKERIFVFTPKREVVILREDSTPIDFAFAIHSDIGFRAKGARVNGKNVPLHHLLENADTVEIITLPNKQAKRQWLGFVKTDKARTKIRQALGIKEFRKADERKKWLDKRTSDLKVRMASCCKPLPGDEIVGYRTTKRKITVHRKGCKNTEKVDKKKVILVTWAEVQKNYSAELSVVAKENASLIPEILKVFSESRITIDATNAKTNRNKITTCVFSLRIKNRGQLEKAMKKISALAYVVSIART